MARPKREDRSTVRDEVLPVIRVTAQENEELRAGAEADGQPITTWLRGLGLRRRKAQKRKMGA